MSKKTKIWLIAAASLVVIGLMMFASALAAHNWDFKRLNTVRYNTNTYEINEEFADISINTDTEDILFVPSVDGKCRVVCYEEVGREHSIEVQNSTLSINYAEGERKWFEYIGINTEDSDITVYLPKTEYGAVVIKESTGDIEIPGAFTFESIDISVSTGDVNNFASASGMIKIKMSTGYIRTENISAGALELYATTGDITASGVSCEGDFKHRVTTGKTNLTDIKCKNFISGGNTGDISLKNVIAAEAFSIERTTGDVTFDGCDAYEIFVTTDTGDVEGSLLSGKIFFTDTSTGDISIPKTMTGGKCEITTNTGDIQISIK